MSKVGFNTRTLASGKPETVPYGAQIYQGCGVSEGQPLPQHWVIMTAPRPICGHVLWRDGGGYGFFWSAIDPNDADTTVWMLERNKADDATMVFYVTEEEAIERQRAYYLELYAEKRGADWVNSYVDDPSHRAAIVEGYLRRVNV